MVKQRLSKVIYCIALSVSVFFCTFMTVLADETEETTTEQSGSELQDGDIAGQVVVEGASQEFDLSIAAELGSYDYTGVTSIHTQKTYGWVQYSNLVGSDINAYHGLYTFDTSVPVLFRMAVERGHTYSGQIYFMLHVNFPDLTNEGITKAYRGVNISGFEQQSSYDGVSVSYYGFVNFGDGGYSGTCDVTVCVTFDNFQPTFSGDLNVNSMFNISGGVQVRTTVGNTLTAAIWPVFACTVSTDWAGELYDYPTDAIIDSDGTLIKNQTIQQQQIADQQAQQSAQQHDNLVNGYDNAANDSMLADKNSVLQGFEQQQDDAINSGQQHVADFSAQYDTAIFSSMAPSFALVSTMFNTLWNGMGQFSTVLIIGLVLCVAGYILKLKH